MEKGKGKFAIGILVALALIGLFTWKIVWPWIFCRVGCGYGESIRVTKKLGDKTEQGKYADPKGGQQGVLEQMKGPGRHFINPITCDHERVQDVRISPLKFALVENKYGNMPADPTAIIVGPKEKGFQADLLTPGAWRINDYGQKIQKYGATLIPPGYVGVVTVNVGENRGIQDKVLTPGYYNIHPKLMTVTLMEVGYRVWESRIDYNDVTDANGITRRVVTEGSGVSFPLADGKQMYLDITVVWGILPENAPRITRDIGSVLDVESKIIEAQVPSICKNNGSNLTTEEFIQGKTREDFQKSFTSELKELGQEKGIDILIALVRGFYPNEEIKNTIQAAMLTGEEKKTLKYEQDRDEVDGNLEKASQRVLIASADFDAETSALVADANELGLKKAAEIKQEADRQVAAILRQAAEVKKKSKEIIGQAEADVLEAIQGVEADKLKRFVAAYGGPKGYIRAMVAEGMKDDLELELRKTGIGTFWTNPSSKNPAPAESSYSSDDLDKIASRMLLQYLQMQRVEQQEPPIQ